MHTLTNTFDVGRYHPLYVWGCSCGAFGAVQCDTRESAAADHALHAAAAVS